MKKFLTIGLGCLVVVLAVNVHVLAGSGCSGQVKAQGISSNISAEDCAKLCGMTPEECAKLCGGKQNCNVTKIDIKGMTCGSCEKSVTTALEAVPGVYKVIKVDHKEGVALVCADAAKCKGEALTTAVSSKGYQANIIPAVAKSDAPPAKLQKGCAPGCAKTCGAAAKACAKAGTSSTSDKASAETKTDGGTK